MNRIAVVSMMKNEADIVESSIRHWALFADKIFIRDHKSTDRTREIIESLKSEGLAIEVATFERDELLHSEVMTDLMNRAFDENFDIVLPLDTDEFPIYIDGNSEDLRRYLQKLDTNQYYRVPLYECRFTDFDSDKFVLARSIVKDPKISSIMPKVIACREFLKDHPAKIAQGNHTFEFIRESQPFIIDSKIFYAHFAIRSPEQTISKHVTAWLNILIRGTRYTTWGSHHHEFLRRYLKDPNVAKIDLTGLKPIDLSAYRDECQLKFLDVGKINPIRNVFLLAENFAETINRERILSNHETVRIFLLFDGDVQRAIQSLDSIFNQSYKFIKIFVVLLTRKNIGEFVLSIEDKVTRIEFVERDKFLNKLESPDGDYIQLMLSGDKFHRDRILHMVEAAHSTTLAKIFMSEISYPANFNRAFLPTEFKIGYDPKVAVMELHGRKQLVIPMLCSQSIFASILSRLFFHQETFNNVDWISQWLSMANWEQVKFESNSNLFFINICRNETVCSINENLVERGCRDWTELDLEFYKSLCNQILQKIKR